MSPLQCKMRLYIACFEQSRVKLTSVEYSIGVGCRGINYHCFKFIIGELLQSSTLGLLPSLFLAVTGNKEGHNLSEILPGTLVIEPET